LEKTDSGGGGLSPAKYDERRGTITTFIRKILQNLKKFKKAAFKKELQPAYFEVKKDI
jgi:hypothetical protein